MAPPTNRVLLDRERQVREAIARLDPQGLTPPVLVEAIVEALIMYEPSIGRLQLAAIDMPRLPQGQGQGQGGRGGGQGRGRGGSRGRGQGGQSSVSGAGQDGGATNDQGSSGQQ
ncbi:hypothetical protein F5Y12DRAFT_714097 [Xylaria sp. FL1777]|nr:hypothetical protein F5Y12DRAFT_714097 [Xylaria sp. FL1777]